MRELELQRLTTGSLGTSGRLRPYGEVTLLGASQSVDTLELPWRKNLPMVSCIPAGSYICQFENHRKFGDTYKVLNVPMRSGIYIHRGNYTSEIRGCILVGTELIGSIPLFLNNSREGHKELMGWLLDPGTKLYEKQFVLHIRGVG